MNDLSPVARELKRSKEEILQEWEGRARAEVSSAQLQSPKSLRDSLPKFLDILARALTKGSLEEFKEEITTCSEEHGSERESARGYSLEEALAEYDILRKIIFEVLEKEAPLSIKARDIIYESIYLGIANAAKVYSQQQMRKLEEAQAADIKKIIKAQEALKASEQRFRHLFANAPVGMCEVNPANLKIIRANPKFYSMLGYSEEELTQMTVEDLTHPDDWVEDKRILQEIKEGRLPAYRREKRYVCKDGSYLWVEVSVTNFEGNEQQPPFNIGVIVDISHRREAEEALRLAQERFTTATLATGVGVWELDLITNTSWRSESHDRAFGYDRQLEDWGFETFMSHVHPEDRDYVSRELADAIENKGVWKVEFRLNFPDKSLHWMSALGKVVKDSEGKPVKVVGINYDITEQKTALNALHEETALRDKFVSTLSHDLRTPLTAAKMSAEIIRRRVNEEPAPTLSSRIVDNLNRANMMIEDILDASKIRAGQMIVPEIQDIDMVEVARSTLEDLTSIHGDRFKLKAPPHVRAHLCPHGMRRIIENLCTNAVKYGSPDEPVQVALESGNSHVYVCVKNAGHPMLHIDKARLFEPFQRGSATEVAGKKGWGIGLTIVKGVTEAHSGEVSVDTNDKGTTFKIKLPIDAREPLSI